MSLLEPILESTRLRIADLPPLDVLRDGIAAAPPARDFAGAISGAGLSVIAEVKRRSPSAGALDLSLDPVRQARAYERGGAAAISVLTEPEYFGGSLDDLRAVRDAVSIPVLRKDFTLDARQIYEGRAAGADAVLLIVAALDAGEVVELLDAAQRAGVDAIVEAHTRVELDVALEAGARIVGINNRDLTTLETDLATAERLADPATTASIAVAESGVSTAEGADRMRRAGFDAILVGEALVRANDPASLIARLRAGP